MQKVNLNLGCGIWLRRGFINVDNYIDFDECKKKKGVYEHAVVEKGAVCVKADIKKMPFPDNYADYVELMNTIEHFPLYQIVDYLREIYRVMKKGAKLVILTNSFSGLCVDWLQMITSGNFNVKAYYDLAEVVYGNQYGGSIGEVHRVPFTPEFMNYVLTQAGFTNGKLFIIPKLAKLPKVGTVKAGKDALARNDLLTVEAIK